MKTRRLRALDLGQGTPPTEQLADLAAWPQDAPIWLRSNFVATVDGSAYGADGRTASINTEADHLLFDAFRATCDVVLVGAGTVRQERYRGIELSPYQQEFRRLHYPGSAPRPALLIVSKSLDLPANLSAGDAGPIWVLTSANADPERVKSVAAQGINVLTADGDVTAEAIIDAFQTQGWRRVLCEGGPRLHGMLLAAGAVDEVCLTVAPLIISSSADPIAVGISDQIDLRLARVDLLDDTVFLRWQRS